jgi:hypothetical protein
MGGLNKVESDLKQKFNRNLLKIKGSLVQFKPPKPKNFWDGFEGYEPDADLGKDDEVATLWTDTEHVGLLAFDND